MKVQELIDALSKLPPDVIVVRAGYEGGVAEATVVSLREIKLHVNEDWYYGPHELTINTPGDAAAVYIN